jgi:hypothetical protein
MTDTPVAPSADDLRAADERTDFRARIYTHLLNEGREVAEEDDRSLNGLLNHALAAYLHQRQMDKARLDRPGEDPVVHISGPWGSGGDYLLEVDGVPVPHIAVHKAAESKVSSPEHMAGPEDLYVLTLDNRFQTGMLTWGEVWTQAWFWAQAMAVAAGWTCHGPNARRIAPHGGEWAEEGWKAMDQKGSLGSYYEVTVRFSLPAIPDDDQRAHRLRRAIETLVADHGGRLMGTDIVGVAPLEAERDSSAPARAPGASIE